MHLDTAILEPIWRLVLAAALGAAIGMEREWRGHQAGIRTYLLVALGSALFTLAGTVGFAPSADESFDPSRVAAQVVTGIGFLCAGAIFREGFTVRGLTTAASLWAAAAVGLAAAAGAEPLALVAVVLILVALGPLSKLEKRLIPKRQGRALVSLRAADTGAVARITAFLDERDIRVAHSSIHRHPRYLTVELRLADIDTDAVALGSALTALAGVTEATVTPVE